MITQAKADYIKNNHKRMSIGEMAKNLQLEPMAVLDFLDENDLSLVKPCAEARRKKTKEVKKPKVKIFEHDRKIVTI